MNGAVKSNVQPLGYFGLKPKDLPRVGIYDGNSDRKWLLPEGEISAARVREFCQSFLRGELKVSSLGNATFISRPRSSQYFCLFKVNARGFPVSFQRSDKFPNFQDISLLKSYV